MLLQNFEKLIIFGARGNTANYFLKILEKERFEGEITVVSRDKNKNNYFKQFKLNFKILNGDIKETNFLEKCFDNIDTVLNLANMENSPKIVEIGSKHKVKWFILVHSTMIFSKNKSKFILNRINIEKDLLKKNKNLTILRPTMIYGNKRDINISRLIKYLDKFKIFPIFGNGKNLLQPVYVDDLSKSYFNVIKNKNITFNKSYNLAGKNSIEYLKILKIIESALKKKIIFIRLPINISVILVKILNILFFGKFPINSSQVRRQGEDKIFSFDEATKDFNFNPIKIEEGLKLQIKDYLNTK